MSAPQALGCAEDLVRSLKESMIDHAGCKVARLSRDESVMSNPVRTTSPGLDRSEREPGVRELSELRLPQVREIPPRWRPPFALWRENPGRQGWAHGRSSLKDARVRATQVRRHSTARTRGL